MIAKNKQIWIAFLFCIALVVLWFSVGTGYRLYQWIILTKTANPISIEWKIEQQAGDRFVLFADYRFKYEEGESAGRTIFQSKRYKSYQTAQHFLNVYSKKNWIVWYSPFQTQNSTIDRYFPLKSSVYTAIVWVIFIYFILLGSFLKK